MIKEILDGLFTNKYKMLLAIIIILYLFIGSAMALWDFRKALAHNKRQQLPVSSVYLERPKFLDNLSVSGAIILILIWPIKITRKVLHK